MDVVDDYSEDSSSEKSSLVAPLTLAVMESLSLPLVQEVVISGDLRCVECQKRINDVISRFNGIESVVVSLSEKKVAITCKYVKATKTRIISRSWQSKVLVLDEDGKIGQKIDELVGKGIFENDKNKKVNIVLNEVVPLLLENPDRWVSSRLTVSSTGEESFHKLNYDECELPETIAENASCTVRCTKVFMDVAVLSDDIDDKHIKIDSRDDLKVLLHHLMSMQNVQDAYAVSLIGLVSNEKAKAMTDYSHVTF
ncbi:uncharacterized protein LOC141598904 isoform X2 [Silene latifolia]|uniref:uncharacterized protein LOC141598904 isoform X2 n=1 Tax=Silene latifolia TaxID=37657 RepID=UPI003D7775ED